MVLATRPLLARCLLLELRLWKCHLDESGKKTSRESSLVSSGCSNHVEAYGTSSAQFMELLVSLRRSLSCEICSDVIVAPFLLTCGHGFCYTCLYEWLRCHQTCPSCRAKVTRKPIYIYQIKAMSDIFIQYSRIHSTTSESDIIQDRQLQQEQFYAKNRLDPFPFVRDNEDYIHSSRIEDPEEHVMRCIRCHWEVDGPECM